MKNKESIKWAFANALGLGIGFLVYLQLTMIFEHGFDTDKYWQWVPPQQSLTVYFGLLISAMVGGAILGYAQSFILKTRGIKSKSWILATVIGFALLIIIDWPLLYSGELGKIPGPIEPLIFTVGGCFLAGLVQYLLLKKQNIIARKWLLMWILGLIVSIISAGLFFTFIGDPLGISWPLETFFSGFIIAGVASLISGKPLFLALRKQ